MVQKPQNSLVFSIKNNIPSSNPHSSPIGHPISPNQSKMELQNVRTVSNVSEESPSTPVKTTNNDSLEEKLGMKTKTDSFADSFAKKENPLAVSEKHMGIIEGVTEEKGNTFEYAVKDRKFLNYVIVLFLLLIGRFGAMIISGDVYNDATVPRINQIILNSTVPINWDTNSTQYYVNLTYLSGSIVGEFMNLVYGAISVLCIIPFLESYIKKTTPSGRKEKDRPVDLAAYMIKKHKIPYHPFILFSFCLLVFNLGFYLCFQNWIYQGVIVFRVLYGACDAIHRYLSFLFITKQFFQQHLIFALGIFFATDSLIQIFSTVLREIASIGLRDILLISNIICAVSVIAIIGLPFLDFEKQSIFKTVVGIKHRDAEDRYYWRKYPALVYIPIHLLLVFILSFAGGFLELLTSEWKYPITWLKNARIMQVFIHAIAMPAIGGILDASQ